MRTNLFNVSGPIVTAGISLTLATVGWFILEGGRSRRSNHVLNRNTKGHLSRRAFILLLISFGATYAVFDLLTGSSHIAFAIAILGSTFPTLLANQSEIRRKKAIEASWPEAMDAIISGLHSGKNISECALELSSRGPILLRPIFLKVNSRVSKGELMENALKDELKDLGSATGDQLFATLRFAKEFGGGATLPALRFLSSFVREDRQVIEEIETKFGWVRNSAALGAAAPWALLLILAMQPSTVSAYATPIGTVILSIGVIATGMAFLWMARISHIPDPPRPFSKKKTREDQQ